LTDPQPALRPRLTGRLLIWTHSRGNLQSRIAGQLGQERGGQVGIEEVVLIKVGAPASNAPAMEEPQLSGFDPGAGAVRINVVCAIGQARSRLTMRGDAVENVAVCGGVKAAPGRVAIPDDDVGGQSPGGSGSAEFDRAPGTP